MLARVRTPHSAEFATPASPSFTVTYNPSPEPPATSQFTFTNSDDGTAAGNYLLVDAGTTISVTLDGATWSSVPVIWSVQPSNGIPVVLMSSDRRTISFTVPAPSHYFQPWIFRLSVDTALAIGVRSPNIYLTNSQPPAADANYILKYLTASGNFLFLDTSSASQDGLVLDAQLVWVNVKVPFRNFSIQVVTDDGSPISFANPPFQWSTDPGPAPTWITWVGDDADTLLVSIEPDAAGQSISLQFRLEFRGVQILSPDPILINATIGDG
jgi:hypothetical protein